MAMRLVPTTHIHEEASHKLPPNRSLGGLRQVRRVNIRRAIWIDTSRDYRGKLGAKDIARRQKAGAA